MPHTFTRGPDPALASGSTTSVPCAVGVGMVIPSQIALFHSYARVTISPSGEADDHGLAARGREVDRAARAGLQSPFPTQGLENERRLAPGGLQIDGPAQCLQSGQLLKGCRPAGGQEQVGKLEVAPVRRTKARCDDDIRELGMADGR